MEKQTKKDDLYHIITKNIIFISIDKLDIYRFSWNAKSLLKVITITEPQQPKLSMNNFIFLRFNLNRVKCHSYNLKWEGGQVARQCKCKGCLIFFLFFFLSNDTLIYYFFVQHSQKLLTKFTKVIRTSLHWDWLFSILQFYKNVLNLAFFQLKWLEDH